MSDADRPIKGHSSAHSPAAQDLTAAAGAAADPDPAQVAADLELDRVGQQFDLLGQAAETSNARRRGAGRPAGSLNKRNAETFDYLEALGYKGPERMLMQIISADPRELARSLGQIPPEREVSFDQAFEVLKLQVKAAADLMPYKLARRPQMHEITRRELHLFVSGDLSLEEMEKAQQNQWADLCDGGNPAQIEGEIVTDQQLSTASAAVQKSAAEPASS